MKVINVTNSTLFRIPFIYLCLGFLWILAGNKILDQLTSGLSQELRMEYQTAKGLTFISVTSILLYILVSQQHKRLQRSEKQYRAIFAGNPHPMFIFNVDTKRIVKVNNAAIVKYGYTKREFEGLSLYDIRPPDCHKEVDDVLALNKGRHEYAGNLTHMKKSGEAFSVSVVGHKVNFNNQDCIMVHVIDINEQVKNEKKIQEAYSVEKELNHALESNNQILEAAYKENRRLGEILNKINNMVIIIDKNGTITWVNQAFSNFTGYTRDEVTGKSPTLLFGPKSDRKIIDELVSRVREGHFFSAELINYTKDGKEYWVQINVSPLFDDEGNFEGTISVENIITDRKENESKIQAQNDALREIAWISSHEFRRPVASIVSIASMLDEPINEDEKHEYIRLLRVSSKQLDDVSRDIASRINELETSCKIS